MFEIVLIQFQFFQKRQAGSAVDLRIAGDAGFGERQVAVFVRIFSDFFRLMRTRADQRKLSFQDIDELREFIQPEFSEYSADAGHARIIPDFKKRSVIALVQMRQSGVFQPVRAGFHRSEFIHVYYFSGADPVQRDHDRSVGITFDGDGDERIQQQQESYPHERSHNIQNSFYNLHRYKYIHIMKIALVHDYLNQYGGAERVLESFSELFPEAPIYTLFYDKDGTMGRFEDRVIETSFLNHDLVSKNHRPFIPLMPLAASRLDLGKEFDVILSSSAGYGKGIRYGEDTAHINYCHTPLRYAWEHKNYFDWHPFVEMAAAPAFWYLRKWDYRAGQKPGKMFANSDFISRKIKKYYGRDSEVLYPPVDLKIFYRDPKIQKQGYFLAVGRMLRYKKFDLIIKAFNRLNLPLLIIGDGPELENLKKLARSPKIHFLSFMQEDELRTYYNGAEAVLFPQEEDFGLVAAEAQACGTPVIAFAQGGAKEIVSDGATGILFDRQTVEDLVMAVKKFQLSSFDEKVIRDSAKRFSKTTFSKRISKIVAAAGVR